MNEELLQGLLSSGNISPSKLQLGAQRNTQRGVRMCLTSAWSARGALQPPAPPPPPDAPHEPSQLNQLLTELSVGSHRHAMASLEDEAAAERIARVARNPAAVACLNDLFEKVKTGDERSVANAAIRAQAEFADVAELLHHENLKLPEGVHGMNPRGCVS